MSGNEKRFKYQKIAGTIEFIKGILGCICGGCLIILGFLMPSLIASAGGDTTSEAVFTILMVLFFVIGVVVIGFSVLYIVLGKKLKKNETNPDGTPNTKKGITIFFLVMEGISVLSSISSMFGTNITPEQAAQLEEAFGTEIADTIVSSSQTPSISLGLILSVLVVVFLILSLTAKDGQVQDSIYTKSAPSKTTSNTETAKPIIKDNIFHVVQCPSCGGEVTGRNGALVECKSCGLRFVVNVSSEENSNSDKDEFNQ